MTIEEDPATPAFWNVRFSEQRMAWDSGSTPAQLDRYLATRAAGDRVLIPGCGSAYEVRSFAERGNEVVAIDFSHAAVARAKAELGPLQTTLVLGDFFAYDFGARPFDLIYERAFLASLPRRLWADYAARVAELLRPGGLLAGFFVYGEQRGGPPFCLKEGELTQLLGDTFRKVEEAAVDTSVPVFAGKEKWEIWRKGQ
jgi:SAM-dependent methyltransferase